VVAAALLAAGIAVGAKAEPTSIADLARAFEASRAMDRGDPAANLYRAGRFDGYLVATAEALAARGEVCLPACFCQVREVLDAELERRLSEPGFDRTGPAGSWLAARLRAAFPCVAH
jgi:hypothetical protein